MITPEVPLDPAEGIRQRARSCIARTGLTQREFAERIGLDPPKLSKALSGTRRFTTEELVRVATVAGVTVNWLLAGSDFAPGAVVVPAASSLPRRVRETPDQGRKRQEIVRAAWRLFAAQGFHYTRLSEIARECGVSASILSYYFSSKRELFEECLRYCVKLAFDRQVAELDHIDDPREQLQRLVDLQLPLGNDMRHEWSIWLQAWHAVSVGVGSQTNYARAYRRWFRMVHDVILEGQQAGYFIPAPADDLATQLTGLFDGLGIKVLVGALEPEAMRTHMRWFIDRVIIAAPSTGTNAAPQPDPPPLG